MEKPLEHRVRRQGVEHGIFPGGKEFCRNLVGFGHRPDPFDIDTERVLTGNGDQGQAMGV